MDNQTLSIAEKLYDIITVAPRLGNKRIKAAWNLENRISYVMQSLEFIGTTKDHNPTHQTDLKTLTKCVEVLEKKAASRHWKKVYLNDNRSIKETDVRDTIDSLKSYIGTEALKKGKKYNKTSNKIDDHRSINIIPEEKHKPDRVCYI